MADKVQHSSSEEDIRRSKSREDILPSQLMEEELLQLDEYYTEFLAPSHAPEPSYLLATPPEPQNLKDADGISSLSAKPSAQRKTSASFLHNPFRKKNKRRPK